MVPAQEFQEVPGSSSNSDGNSDGRSSRIKYNLSKKRNALTMVTAMIAEAFQLQLNKICATRQIGIRD
jgi:hypothetical protein